MGKEKEEEKEKEMGKEKEEKKEKEMGKEKEEQHIKPYHQVAKTDTRATPTAAMPHFLLEDGCL